jgi:hypothetical protein
MDCKAGIVKGEEGIARLCIRLCYQQEKAYTYRDCLHEPVSFIVVDKTTVSTLYFVRPGAEPAKCHDERVNLECSIRPKDISMAIGPGK